MKLQSKLKESEDDEKLHHKFSIEYANLYNDIKNERKDFIHKTSTKLANQYDYVFVENINLAKLQLIEILVKQQTTMHTANF